MTPALRSLGEGGSARVAGRWKMERLERHGPRLLTTVLRPLTSALCPPASALRPPPSVLRLPAYPDLPSPISHLRENASAFSLVELLAVVGIIAMISVAAVPVMRGLGGSQSSRATAQILVSALEQARTAAILSGTNVYLVFPIRGFTGEGTNYYFRSYALVRPKMTNAGGPQDDFVTNSTAPWILISKWERLPGDLMFSSNRLGELTQINVSGLASPGNPAWNGTVPGIGFLPTGGLTETNGTKGLLFASSNKVAGGRAQVADRIEISLYSGRVRYAGVVTNTNF